MILGSIFVLRSQNKPVTRTVAYEQSVETVVSGNVDVVSSALIGLFAVAKGVSSSKFANFDRHPAGDPIFPDDYQLRFASRDNPDLARYISLDPSERRRDLYLVPPVVGPPDPSGNIDYYWESEYLYLGQPVKFRCNFIIHLEPAMAASKISILEYQPEIWTGTKFDLLGHAGPGFYRDIRLVEPTNRDREELLDFVSHGLASELNKPASK